LQRDRFALCPRLRSHRPLDACPLSKQSRAERWLLGKLLGLKAEGSYRCSSLAVRVLAAVLRLLSENLALPFPRRASTRPVTQQPAEPRGQAWELRDPSACFQAAAPFFPLRVAEVCYRRVAVAVSCLGRGGGVNQPPVLTQCLF